MKKRFKIEDIEKMPTNNGKMMRYYLKPNEIDFINKLSINLDKSPSEVMRKIIQSYKEISILIQKNIGGENDYNKG